MPGRTVGASPAVLSVARRLGAEIDMDNITDRAYEELASVGCTKEWMTEKVDILTPEEIIAQADDIIPGVVDGTKYNVPDLIKETTIEV